MSGLVRLRFSSQLSGVIKSRRKRFTALVAAVLSLSVLVFFALRSFVLGRAIDSVSDKLQTKYGYRLKVIDYGFDGLTDVWAKGIQLYPEKGDTLLYLDSLCIRPAIISLLGGRLDLNRLFLGQCRLTINSSGEGNNVSGFRKNSRSNTAFNKSEVNDYGAISHRIIGTLFSLTPQYIQAALLEVSMKTDTFSGAIAITDFSSDLDSLHGVFSERPSGRSWIINGRFRKDERTVSVNAYSTTSENDLPMLSGLLGARIGYDTLRLTLSEADYSSGIMHLQGSLTAKGLHALHPRLASDTVRLDDFFMQMHATMAEGRIELDSSSLVKVGRLTMHPYFLLSEDVTRTVDMRISLEPVAANDFFSSLPAGMFGDVRTLRGRGELSFHMAFRMDTARAKDLTFTCNLPSKDFRITDYGTTGLLRINSEFNHEVWLNGRLARTFMVGPTNPYFVPLEAVSPYFVNAVLTSEDGNFRFHNGFNEEAFRKSIYENYKSGRFKRGGSTITMQLVKNVFLTRKKTVARKVEEALIVWLLESKRLVSKERLLEVYFNIIELGPDVYGIGEASRYYFNTRPSDLDLSQSIFLAGLLPRPKAFSYSFDSTGHLKPYMADYYRVMTNFMVKKQLISPEQAASVVPDVHLTGPAAALLRPTDSVTVVPEIQ